MEKKTLIGILICILMVVSMIHPVSATTSSEKTSQTLTIGNILHVGGLGPNNYTKIQDAINDSSNGDTVYVHDDSSPYHETLTINKSIALVGENKETTVIENYNVNSNAVRIWADNVRISGFTFSIWSQEDSLYYVIYISKMAVWPGTTEIIEYVTISDNNFDVANHTNVGIGSLYLDYGTIDNNSFNGCYFGVKLLLSSHTIVTHNIITNCEWGIGIYNIWSPRYHLWFLHPQFGDNTISKNRIAKNQIGIVIDGDRTTNDKILENNVSSNEIGIMLGTAFKSEIARNNFIGNNISAEIDTERLLFYPTNSWHDNYWDEPKQSPVSIHGSFWFFLVYTGIGETSTASAFFLGKYPVIAFDRTPAQEPYDTEG